MRKPGQVKFAKALRRNQSLAEAKLWLKLRSRQLNGVKFRRQHPLGKYIIDFICLERKLIIEIDGGQHNCNPNIIKDEQRTAWLVKEGYNVLRFWNNDILENIDGVFSRIIEVLNAHHT